MTARSRIPLLLAVVLGALAFALWRIAPPPRASDEVRAATSVESRDAPPAPLSAPEETRAVARVGAVVENVEEAPARAPLSFETGTVVLSGTVADQYGLTRGL